MGSADEWAQSPRDHDGLKSDWVKLLMAEVCLPESRLSDLPEYREAFGILLPRSSTDSNPFG